MDYASCTSTDNVCLQIWLIDDTLVIAVISLVTVFLLVKIILKFIPFIG